VPALAGRNVKQLFVAVAAAALLAACGDVGTYPARALGDPVGVYRLLSIDGKKLPVPLSDVSSFNYIAGKVTLRADHTGTEEVATAPVSGAVGSVGVSKVEGTWALVDSTLTMPNGNPATLVNGTITYAGWVYRKD